MTKLNQKSAVYNAITSVLSEHGVQFEDGMDISGLMTKELRSEVNSILVEGFKSGMIELSKEFDDSDLKAYVSGLQSNWIRKDKRFNGGTQYVAKNPGTRVGSGDPTIKNLRALRSTLTDPSDIAEVDAHIAARVAELKPAKQAPTVDFSSLPEALRNKFAK
jgi:hypothetical protein